MVGQRRRLCTLALAVTMVLLSTMKADGAKRRMQKDWSKVDFDAIDKEWENGDEEAELLSDFEIEKRENEKRQAAAPKFDPE